MGRSPHCSRDGLKRGPWTADEDKMLSDYIKVRGEGKWSNVARETGLRRCGKSCRLRWMNYLRPDIKRGNISQDEEELIIRLHKLLGNRWSLIAGRLPGRTGNEIKNYWNTNLARKARDSHSIALPKTESNKSERGGRWAHNLEAWQDPIATSLPRLPSAVAFTRPGQHPINKDAANQPTAAVRNEPVDGRLCTTSGDDNCSPGLFDVEDLCELLDTDLITNAIIGTTSMEMGAALEVAMTRPPDLMSLVSFLGSAERAEGAFNIANK